MTERLQELLSAPLIEEAKKQTADKKVINEIIKTAVGGKSGNLWQRYLDRSKKGDENCKLIHYADILLCIARYFNPNKNTHVVDEKADVFVTDDIYEAVAQSIAGKRVVHISMDDRTFMYGPYGAGNFIVMSRDGSKIRTIDVEKLFSSIEKERFLNAGFDIWISRFDRDGFLKYVPFTPMDVDRRTLLKWIYRAVWKSTINREIKVGDPQRFLTVGEKYIDRVVDIDKEVEDLFENVFSKYDNKKVIEVIRSLTGLYDRTDSLKKISFEGMKAAKDLLVTATVEGEKHSEFGKKKEYVESYDDKIFNAGKDTEELMSVVEFFRASREELSTKDVFPSIKKIVLSYEDLFSRASFLAEVIQGLVKKSGEEMYG